MNFKPKINDNSRKLVDRKEESDMMSRMRQFDDKKKFNLSLI